MLTRHKQEDDEDGGIREEAAAFVVLQLLYEADRSGGELLQFSGNSPVEGCLNSLTSCKCSETVHKCEFGHWKNP